MKEGPQRILVSRPLSKKAHGLKVGVNVCLYCALCPVSQHKQNQDDHVL